MKSLHNVSSSDNDRVHAGALERIIELGVRLADQMDRGLAEQGLSRARAEVIWRLGEQGPITQRALSQLLRVTPRNVTGLVDALEADGFVSRQRHPTDRRATLVTLTEKGADTARQMRAGYRDLSARLFGTLSATELRQFIDTLDRVLVQLREGTGESTQPEHRAMSDAEP